ncbi:hypothetical protein PR001_g23930, partial [Phytophthora rubi]
PMPSQVPAQTAQTTADNHFAAQLQATLRNFQQAKVKNDAASRSRSATQVKTEQSSERRGPPGRTPPGSSDPPKKEAGKSGSSRRDSARKISKRGNDPHDSDPDSDSDKKDDESSDDSDSSFFEESIPNAMTSKTSQAGTTVFTYKPYVNASALEDFNEKASLSTRIRWLEKFQSMAVQGGWSDKMRIYEMKLKLPSSARDCVSTAVKSKGRPKIRRKQTREAKKIRMEGSVAEANALVQGTLIPVKDLALIRKTMSRSLNVADALPVLNSIEQVDAPSWKSTAILLLARKQKVHRKVTIVFPKNYVSKCIAGIATYRKSLPSDHNAGRMGVSIKKLGTFAEEDLITMLEWNDESPKVMAVNDLAEWIRVPRFTRISLPSPLNNCATVDMQACAKRLENVGLKTSISTRFGPVSVHELAFFRRSEWLDDSCVKLDD